jgi:hypothetical protein
LRDLVPQVPLPGTAADFGAHTSSSRRILDPD